MNCQAPFDDPAVDRADYPVPLHRCHVMVRHPDTGAPGPCYAMHPCGRHGHCAADVTAPLPFADDDPMLPATASGDDGGPFVVFLCVLAVLAFGGVVAWAVLAS